jgi:precorrin-6A/cobalt-precorrin-6A reductase
MRRILLLGGTLEARQLAEGLAGRDDVKATISLAGVTGAPPDFGLEKRVGGFGGISGLCNYITEEEIDVLIDATHPYAAQMSRHAAEAATKTGIARLCLSRPPWQAGEDDDWREFKTWDDLIAAIPPAARVFLAAGQDGLLAFDRAREFSVLARALTRPEGLRDDITLLRSPPLESAEHEAALFEEHHISHLVCKNSGGTASSAKLAAARRLGLPVLMLARPQQVPGENFADVDAILKLI